MKSQVVFLLIPLWLLYFLPLTCSIKRVLAAVDMESESDDQQKTALNKQILEMASSLALLEFGELHIIHAWMRNGHTMLDSIDCSVLAVKPPGFITPVTLSDEGS